ncbi:hypothetical protein F5884DRAFT_827462 [Xylogone sp. PMI_703]|nr:hypothetical protein F5884DRAFT_827462 [Xylogone sp. PMI_703]
MAISWGTIKSLILFFGPLLLPKAIAYYRSLRAQPAIQGVQIVPVPPAVSRALAILFATAVGYIIKTLPNFSPENIFAVTQSRLQIPTDVLFTRLTALRPQGLTDRDAILRTKINSLESRLLYFQFGPDVMIDCPVCFPEEPHSYLYYSIPSILAPHLLNLIILAIATSGLFTGKAGAKWRSTATTVAIGLACLDVYLVSSYAYQANARATRLEDIDTFFWKMRVYRSLALAAVDGLLGWVIYLTATNRFFVSPPSTSERIELATRIIDAARGKINAVGVLRNTIARDEELRGKSAGYWIREGQLMGEVMTEREVVAGIQNALESRINVTNITADAEAYANGIIGPVPGS